MPTMQQTTARDDVPGPVLVLRPGPQTVDALAGGEPVAPLAGRAAWGSTLAEALETIENGAHHLPENVRTAELLRALEVRFGEPVWFDAAPGRAAVPLQPEMLVDDLATEAPDATVLGPDGLPVGYVAVVHAEPFLRLG